ncbi:MAG: CHAP domain-containing protein [[Ruminococcus] faecis]|nr:CHAP domain-containing protein [Mediterraneibacter faecis]
MADTERLDRMHFNAKEERKFKATAFALKSTQQSIKTSKQHLTALSMGNNSEGEEYETDPIIDPTRFLDRREIHQWNQLAGSKKNRYIAEGIKAAEKSLKSKTWLSNGEEDFTEEIEKKTASLYTNDLHHIQEISTFNIYGSTGDYQQKNPQKRFRRKQNGNSQDENKKGTSVYRTVTVDQGASQEENYSHSTSGQIKPQAKAGTGSQSLTGSASTGSTKATGGGMVVMAGKKAADKFKVYMQEQSMVQEQAVRNAEAKMMDIRNENHEMDSLPTSIKYIGATVGAVILSVLAVIVQAAFSIFAVLVGVVIAILIPIIAVITIISTLISIIASLVTMPVITGGGERIVQIALQEENNTSGAKYWNYVMGSRFVNGDVTPWCACFVSWCANEAGLIDSGVVPKAAAVRAYHRFYAEKGRFHSASENYTPQPGDFIIFGNDSHIGIVQYVENGRVITIEGNTSDAVHSRSYAIGSSYITGYCNPEYPAGTTIEIPEGMGTYHTYMGWRTITSSTSLQYQLRERSGEHYDSEGFAIIDGRYVIACTTLYGQVGDYVDFQRENGEIIHAVIGDIKNQNDAGCNQYGHDNGKCVVEFVVKKSTWYPSHANPGTAGCHPEWNSRVVRAVNTGYNYLQQ